MAKTLPAITITDAQYVRLGAALPGRNAAEKEAAYELVVRNMLRQMVLDSDRLAAAQVYNAALDSAEQNPDNL